MMRDSKLGDKFVFVEDYDINVGRHFVQGVDVWLNNPRRPTGTMGSRSARAVHTQTPTSTMALMATIFIGRWLKK